MVNPVKSIHSAVPVVVTDDIEKSILYYTDILGFSPDFKYGEPPAYAGVRSGDVEIYFTLDAELTNLYKESKLHPEVFIWVEDAQSLFNLHVQQGADIVEPVADRPWGARQYVIRELNGYHLKFAQSLNR